MALVHDLAECIVGDLTPSSGVSKEEKHAQEKVTCTRNYYSRCELHVYQVYSMSMR